MLVDLELEIKCLTFNEELIMFPLRIVVTVLSCLKDAFFVSYCGWKVFSIQLVQYNLVLQNVGYIQPLIRFHL